MISKHNLSFLATGVEMQVTKKLCSKRKSPQDIKLGGFYFTLQELQAWATVRLPAFEF
jgi:hypothetical protein